MSTITLPAIVPGAVIHSGAVQKQPHGMFSSMRGKQLRFMELKMCDDLTPVLMYYEHPKSDAAVAKGILILDRSAEDYKVSFFKERKEIEICSSLESQGPEAVASFVRSCASVVGSAPHIVSDLALAFETSSDYQAWVDALYHAFLIDINAEAIASTSPTLILTQVPPTSAPAPEGQVYYEEGLKLYAASYFKDAIKCFDKAVAMKHQLAHAMLSEILYFGRTGVAVDYTRSHKLALAGADMGCVHCCGVLALLTVGSLFINDETDEASDAKHAAKGFELATRSARANSPFGFLALYMMYDRAIHVDKNDEVAIRYLKLAAAQGYPIALLFLGQSFRQGAGVQEDKLEAVRLFRLASDQGDYDAHRLLGMMFFSGEGVGCNKVEAANFFRLAADDAHAQTLLARMLYDGDGLDQDKVEAVRLYRLAAENDHAEAQFELGIKFLRKEIQKEPGQVLSHEEKAVRLIRSAAELGHAAAQYQFALWLLEPKLPDGASVSDENKEIYLQFMTAAADQGLANAQIKVAIYYEGKSDFMLAAKYAELAAEQEHPDGYYWMGVCILASKGSQADVVKVWRDAAERGHATAQAMLSMVFHDEENEGEFRGFEQGYVEAVKFARLSADQGHELGQELLGKYYYFGRGVVQDFAEALRWYRLAADQGSVRAQLMVGEMYQAGQGVEVNVEEGARYCRLAMDQGNVRAHLIYAVLTTNNGVMPNDQDEINRLWIRGAASGHPHIQLSMAKVQVDKDKDQAMRLCALAVAKNYAPALTFMAKMLTSGDGSDKQQAVQLLTGVWERDPEAALALGTMYYRGDEPVEKDGTKACMMLMQAYENGLEDEVLAALSAGGFQGAFADFMRETLPEELKNMPGVAWSKYFR